MDESPATSFISVGFCDRAFLFPGFVSEVERNGSLVREEIDLIAKHGPEAVENPHFTFHPPAHFHLKSENDAVLLEALVWTEPEPGHEVSPWIRFVSNPIRDLLYFKGVPHGRTAELHTLNPQNEDCSIAVHLDFVSAPGNVYRDGAKIAHFISWGGVTLRLYAYSVPPQEATLGYAILG